MCDLDRMILEMIHEHDGLTPDGIQELKKDWISSMREIGALSDTAMKIINVVSDYCYNRALDAKKGA